MASVSQHSVLTSAPDHQSSTIQSRSPPTPPKSPVATSTNTSAVAPQSQVRQRRPANTAVQKWQPIDLGNVRCYIVEAYGQTLVEESLKSMAIVLLRMDREILSTITQKLRFSLSARTDNETKARSEQELESLLAINAQIEQILEGKARIHANYLTDEYLLRYWEEALLIVGKVFLFDSKEMVNYQVTLHRLNGLEKLALDLSPRVSYAAERGHITSDIRSILREKWTRYDEMIDMYHERGLEDFRTSIKWPGVASGLVGYDSLDKQLSAKKESRTQILTTLWINFGVLTVLSMAFMSVGYFYSSEEYGKWRDPDFWFLLQSSTVQLGGLLITGLSFDDASMYDWASGSVATVFAFVAPVLYLKAPSQYSMLSSAASGVFQALLILQRSICYL